MSYENMSIKEAMDKIAGAQMFLPSIQRHFVWEAEDAAKLLDSIMLGYPIGAFLFWKIKRVDAVKNNYVLYEFIRDYDPEKYKNNDQAPRGLPGGWENIYSVLDGQQRLTSLYISFHGSIVTIGKRKRRKIKENYVKKELYLNLNKDPNSDEETNNNDLKYEFKFLSETEAENEKVNSPEKFWFKVKDITCMSDDDKDEYMDDHRLGSLAKKNMRRLFNIYNSGDASQGGAIISYFPVKSDTSLESVLDIFVRVNAGGKKLSKSDLLFSTVISSWTDGRKKVEELIETINKQEKSSFDFNIDFIMRTCLYLVCETSELKVENLTPENVDHIKNDWKNISESIKKAVELLTVFGFCTENLVSKNAVIPIVYYIYKRGVQNFTEKESLESKQELKKYLIVAQVKQLFGAAGNSALSRTKKALDENCDKFAKNGFRLEYFKDLKFVAQRDFSVNDELLEGILDYEKGSAYAFMILSLLYPHVKLDQWEWHQDHMHPYAKFSDSNLKKLGLTEDKIKDWQEKRNRLPNLQLLEGTENKSKNDADLKVWAENNPGVVKYLPEGVSLDLENFDEFYAKRREMMKEELKKILNYTDGE